MAAAVVTIASALYWYRPEIGRVVARYRPRLADMAAETWPCRCRRLLAPLRRAAAAAASALHLTAVMFVLERYSRAAVAVVVTARIAVAERLRQAVQYAMVVRTAVAAAAVTVWTAVTATVTAAAERRDSGRTGAPCCRADRRRTRSRCVQTEEDLVFEYWEGPPLVQVQVGMQ